MILINADDFGLHPDINQGILECLQNKTVNSVSIAVASPLFKEEDLTPLRDLKAASPSLSLGIHLMLTEGKGLTKALSLTDAQDSFPGYVDVFLKKWLSGKIKLEEVEKEWEAQIQVLVKHGLTPAHLDSHQHVHLFPGLWGIALRLKEKYKIPRIRTSYESFWSALKQGSPKLMAYQMLAGFRYFFLPKGMKTLGVLHSCDFSYEVYQHKIPSLWKKKKDFELMVHPANQTPDLEQYYSTWKHNWSREKIELEKVRDLLEALEDYPRRHPQIMDYYQTLPKGSRYFMEGRSKLCHFGLIEKLYPKQGKILDVGCGHAYMLVYLKLASAARELRGIDLNNEKIVLVQPFLKEKLGIDVRFQNLFDLPFDENNSFDAGSLLDVLCLIPYEEQVKILENLYQRIKPGGVFIMKESHKGFYLQYWIAYWEELLVNSLRFRKLITGFYYRSREEWIELLTKIGFSRVETFKTPLEKINNYSYLFKAYKS